MIDPDLMNNAVEFMKNRSYGDSVTHEGIAKYLKVEPQTPIYYQAMQKIKTECLSSGKMLQSVQKIGYRIAEPDDYSEAALREVKNGSRRLSYAAKIIRYAPVNRMTDEGRSVFNQVSGTYTALNAQLKGGVIELTLLQKKHPLAEPTTNEQTPERRYQ